jgi:hypothetical protein
LHCQENQIAGCDCIAWTCRLFYQIHPCLKDFGEPLDTGVTSVSLLGVWLQVQDLHRFAAQSLSTSKDDAEGCGTIMGHHPAVRIVKSLARKLCWHVGWHMLSCSPFINWGWS